MNEQKYHVIKLISTVNEQKKHMIKINLHSEPV